ncbi:MAG: hypothetical protein K1X72_21970 [Pyrinomonadaceae bacterium]|nr:hypothetical protein [Pyrinomonadaceae bacterium]
MLKKYLPVFIVFLFGVLGCASTDTVESTKVSPGEIYQSYIINGTKNSTSVNATFRVGGSTGSTVDLDAPAKVEHNGKEMNESKPGFFKGTDYNDSANQFVPNHKFRFTDAAGKVWENEISVEGLEITSQNLSVSKTNGATITLSRAIGKDENVEFNLTSDKTPPASSNSNSNAKTPEKNYSTSLKVDFDESRTVAKIEPSSLKNFVDGTAKIYLTLRKNKSTQQAAKGGSMDFNYESQKIAVNVLN